ncbi:pirin family protein [Microlunatus speluncae]|uniref:pirin family protein n=1 Tax=Microlunatus speluncae TaxID=2594267 RepID=UPI00126687C1|nr:pirin family protein [Microlunatus speluncae]
MSDVEARPGEYDCGSAGAEGPEALLLPARTVWLGKTTQVARALPDRTVRMIGAWCFLDHYGPEDVSDSPGMRVWAHPHTGLQTVTWLLAGEIDHADSLGSRVRVRPGELHLMTAGRGIVHSELSPAAKPPISFSGSPRRSSGERSGGELRRAVFLHGLQLWLALPDSARFTEPRFVSHPELPVITGNGVTGIVLLGEIDGVASPADTYTPLLAVDLDLEPGAEITLPLTPEFEYGAFTVSGTADVAGTRVEHDQLLYLGTGRRELGLRSREGGRILLLGGEPFAEEIVMWWNFVGRDHDEVAGYRQAWLDRADRFPPVVDRSEPVMEAPAMPSVPLRPRPRRRR